MKKLARKCKWAVSAMACAAVLLSGCGSNTTEKPAGKSADAQTEKNAAGADESVTIRLDQFSGSGASEEALKKMIAKFNEQYPNVKVELQSFGYDDYFTQLQSKIVGGSAADVFELNFENFVAYASEDVLLDIGDLIGDTSGFNQTALEAFKYDGKQFGIPNSFSNVVLIYNKDLFDKAGVSYPTDDWTWTELSEAAKKIRALSADTYGLYRPLSFHEFYKGVKQNGGSLLSEDGKNFTVNLPQNVETLEIMSDWVTGSNVMPSDAQMGGMGDWDLFKSGRLGMIVTGIWAFSDFTDNCDFAWDVAVEPGNTAKATHFFSNAYVVNKETANPEAAAALAAFLAGSKEAAQIRVDASWELPPVTYQDVLDSYLKVTPPENREAVFKSLDYLVTPPVVKQQSEMQEIISKHLNNAVSGNASAKDALDACQAELEQKIKLN
ncbi:ABC transporter substrate-binding protein [Lacrimispora celerecrescens]|uniref:Sugar ABC transporter substrate-binding protein n=1 Tax=Lacrimispora celerecrescens TaxID=29354 RepID=A0A084JPX4_9FIRM|nr:sugar ABC transporter substrate-binding protein [Lacrimispora celerecrescens]KEZ91008.1 sugar ABC transporter substrate-binding protein [Lacrimispora celerecrescens]